MKNKKICSDLTDKKDRQRRGESQRQKKNPKVLPMNPLSSHPLKRGVMKLTITAEGILGINTQ